MNPQSEAAISFLALVESPYLAAKDFKYCHLGCWLGMGLFGGKLEQKTSRTL